MVNAVFAQALVLLLDGLVLSLLWFLYRNARERYLALGIIAVLAELSRTLIDTMILAGYDPQFMYRLSSGTQLGSTAIFYCALWQLRRGTESRWNPAVPISILFIAVILATTLTGIPNSAGMWYLYFSPLLVIQALIVWFAFASLSSLSPGRVLLCVSAMMLGFIRGWLPSHMLYDELFNIVYYMETVVVPIMYASLGFFAIESSQRQTRALLADQKESGKLLQFIADSTLDIILIADSDDRLMSWNQRAENILGYSDSEAIGQLTINDLVVLDDRTRSGQDNVSDSVHGARVRHKDLTEFEASVQIRLIKREEQSFRVYIIEDVSAREQLRKRKAIIDEDLERTNRLKSLGVLAGGIAHDFNNILMTLYANLNLARKTITPDHQGHRYLLNAEGSIDRAIKLSNQLLTFARGGEPVVSRFDFANLLRDAVQFNLAGTNVLPVLTCGEEIKRVVADRSQVEQIVSNLSLNAMEAMPHGGSLFINLANATDDLPARLAPGTWVKVTFRDEGAGIDPSNIGSIFDPYFTTKQAGSGLGLATSHSIVERHGGLITVESVVGEGTTFTVYLPADESHAVDGPEAETGQAFEFPTDLKLLVMDDDPGIRNILQDALSGKAEVTTVADGNDAVARFYEAYHSDNPFDVLLLDLTIPGGIGGTQVAKIILGIDSEIKLIASSGYTADDVLSNFREYGFHGILRKPYTLEALEEAVASAVDEKFKNPSQ